MKEKVFKYLKLKTLLVVLLIYQFSSSFSSANTESLSDFKPFRVKGSSLFVCIDSNILQLPPYYKLIADRNELWKVPTEINSRGLNTPQRLSSFLLKHNKDIGIENALKLAKIYVKEAKSEGINHDIAFSQMCLETGFLSYKGSVKADQNNFCGLGAIDQFSCGDKFESIQEGVRAHIQHLKAYSSNDQLSNGLVDARFRFVKRGIAPNVSDLTGKWATDQSYGQKIANLLNRLYSVEMI